MADSGTSGSIYHFAIGRKTVAGITAGQAHTIDFFMVGGGKSAFANEVSDANALYIDKIRCTYGNDLVHFDVHYSSSNSADVYVDFTVEGNTLAKQTAVAESLQAVADAPTGETVLTTHSFTSSTEWSAVITKTGTASATLPSDWKELIVNARFGGNPTYGVSYSIRQDCMQTTTGENYMQGSYNASNDYHFVGIQVASTYVKLLSWNYRGTDYTSSSTIYVQYKC